MKLRNILGIIGFFLAGITSPLIITSSPITPWGASGWEFISENPLAIIYLIIGFFTFALIGGIVGFLIGSFISWIKKKIQSYFH